MPPAVVSHLQPRGENFDTGSAAPGPRRCGLRAGQTQPGVQVLAPGCSVSLKQEGEVFGQGQCWEVQDAFSRVMTLGGGRERGQLERKAALWGQNWVTDTGRLPAPVTITKASLMQGHCTLLIMWTLFQDNPRVSAARTRPVPLGPRRCPHDPGSRPSHPMAADASPWGS